MPKKKGGKKKKGAEEVVEVLARDFGAEFEPVDGMDGEVGLEHLEFARKVDEVAERIAEMSVIDGSTEKVSIAGLRLHELPASLLEEDPAAACTTLVASDNLLVNSAASALVAIRNLEYLDLTANFLVGVAPAALGELRKLEELILGDNKLTSIPDDWSGMVMLRQFVAPRNELTEINPTCVSSWPRLQVLDVRSNKLKGVPTELCSSCVGLKQLIVSGNEIVELPAGLGGLRSLEVLDASKNKLTAVPGDISSCSKLKTLGLAQNAITGLPADLFGAMASLRTLNLHTNKIGDLPSSIGSCSSLEVVTLSNNSLKTLPEELGACAKVTEFYCNHNASLTAVPASLKAWTTASAISFKGCKLKGLPEPEEEFAAAWSGTLRHLDVTSKGKKPSCKLPKEAFSDKLYRTEIVGAAEKKVKKAKKGKKK